MRPQFAHLAPLRVCGTATSGNCHKVRLALDLLRIPYRWHQVDIMKGETRTLEYLAMNPNGKVPLLRIDDHTWLPESNAILCYLADGTELWPGDRLARAQALQWMFFERYSHEPYIAVARFVRVFLKEARRCAPARAGKARPSRARRDAGPPRTQRLLRRRPTHDRRHRGRYAAVRARIDRCPAQPGVTAMPSPR